MIGKQSLAIVKEKIKTLTITYSSTAQYSYREASYVRQKGGHPT